MAYSSYLQEHVQIELTKAIADASIKNPKDPVEYLGNYLLKIVEDDAKKKQQKEIYAQWDKEDEELELKRKEKELMLQKKDEEAKINKLKDEEFYTQLSKCETKTDAMKLWCEYMQNKSKSISVYIGSPCQLKKDDEDVNALLYNAVSSMDDQFLMNTTFIQSETKGIIFDLFEEEEKSEEENEEDENEETKKEEEPKPRKHIHIKNVLLPNPYKDRLHFFTYPKVGSFLSFQSSIKSYLNNEAIQATLRPQWPRPIEEILAEQKAKEEAEKKANEENKENKEDESGTKEETEKKEDIESEEQTETNEEENNDEEKEKEELAPDPPQIPMKYVISMDTLGSAQLYDTDTIQFIDESIGKFEDILMKIDTNQYLKQREFEQNLKNKLIEYEEKTKDEINKKLEEIEKENESNGEQIKLFKTNQYSIEAMQSIWSLISDHKMVPEQSSFCRIIAAFVKLFDTKEENKLSLINNKLSQFDVMSNTIWNECIMYMKEITSEKINGYNPTEIELFDIALFDKLLNGIVGEEIGNEGLGIVFTKLYEFVDSVCKLYKFTEEEKKKAEEKSEEKTNEETEATGAE